jgi:hypothetical protein
LRNFVAELKAARLKKEAIKRSHLRIECCKKFMKLKWWKILAPKLNRRLPMSMKYEDVAKMLGIDEGI